MYLKRLIFKYYYLHFFLSAHKLPTLSRNKYSSFTAEQTETRDAVGVHEDHAVPVHAWPCGHGNVVVLFVLHNREPMQPWPRSQSVTSSSTTAGLASGHVRAPYHRALPSDTTIGITAKTRRLLQTKQPPSNDLDLFADSCTLSSFLLSV